MKHFFVAQVRRNGEVIEIVVLELVVKCELEVRQLFFFSRYLRRRDRLIGFLNIVDQNP